jgi:hypothetical protein
VRFYGKVSALFNNNFIEIKFHKFWGGNIDIFDHEDIEINFDRVLGHPSVPQSASAITSYYSTVE